MAKKLTLQLLWDLTGGLNVSLKGSHIITELSGPWVKCTITNLGSTAAPIVIHSMSLVLPRESEGFKDIAVILELFLKCILFKTNPSAKDFDV